YTLAPALSSWGSAFAGTWANHSATSLAGSISAPGRGGAPPAGTPPTGAAPTGVALAGDELAGGGLCLTAAFTTIAHITTAAIHVGAPIPRFAGSGGAGSAGRGAP